MKQALVIRNTGKSYTVALGDGTELTAYVKGNFRIKGIRSTNPVAVGDNVTIEQQSDGTNWIVEVVERRNYIVRRSTNLSKDIHILAANIDRVALLVTINHPQTNTIFIDRFLATAEAYNVPAVLVFNKVDLLTADELEYLKAMRGLYEYLGYATFAISALSFSDRDADCHSLRKLLGGSTTLLSGNSGVGKSTLLNALFGAQVARTGDISSAHDKGMHTTTFSAMYTLTDDHSARVIDTPGIKGFGSFDMQPEEISHYFPEIFREGSRCRFSNCTHTHEPDCAVRKAVDEQRIALSRYQSYLSMLSDYDESKYR